MKTEIDKEFFFQNLPCGDYKRHISYCVLCVSINLLWFNNHKYNEHLFQIKDYK